VRTLPFSLRPEFLLNRFDGDEVTAQARSRWYTLRRQISERRRRRGRD